MTTSYNKSLLKNYQVTINLVVFLCPVLKSVSTLKFPYLALF